MTAYFTPVNNIHGDNRAAMADLYVAQTALESAIDAICKASPHYRDFANQDDYNAARDVHNVVKNDAIKGMDILHSCIEAHYACIKP